MIKGNKGQTPLIIGIALILIIVGFLFLSNSGGSTTGNTITGNIIKSLQNCRDVQVPYQVEETYNYYLKNQIISGYQNEKLELFGKGVYTEGIVMIKNIDNEAGWFIVTFSWETLNNEKKDKVRHYIEPDEIIEFKSIYDNNFGEDIKFQYNALAEPIQKTKKVTKYRTEEKCS